MNFDTAIAALQAARDPKIATIYERRSPGTAVWGVRFGDMEKIVKAIRQDSDLARKLGRHPVCWSRGSSPAG